MTSTETAATPTAFTEAPTNTFQDKALRAKADYRAKTDAITANTNLTPEGKTEKLRQLREQTQAQLADLQTQHQQAIQTRTAELTARLLDRNPTEGNDPALATSYRDAAVQASRIDNEQAATTLMKQALRNQDTPLEKSLLRIAFDARWPDVINTYTATRKNHYDAAEELWRLTDPHENVGEAFINAFAYQLT